MRIEKLSDHPGEMLRQPRQRRDAGDRQAQSRRARQQAPEPPAQASVPSDRADLARLTAQDHRLNATRRPQHGGPRGRSPR
jgi:hypothetical protein